MRRIVELDALRGVAAVVIMLAHIGLVGSSAWVFSCVDFFFVLSGYFITTNILKNGHSTGFLGVFFVRRALRIWPTYYLTLAACLLISPFLPFDTPTKAWLYYLTFTQNIHDYFGWVPPSFSGMFKHTWTLAIEEQFYLLWPVLLFCAGRRGMLAIVLGFAALPLALRASGFSPYLLLTRCDGLALGSLLAWLLWDREHVSRHLAGYRRAFLVIGLVALVVPPWLGLAEPSVGVNGPLVEENRLATALFTTRASLIYFALAGLVLCAHGQPILKPLRDPRLAYLGVISYGLYLNHPLVFATMPRLYQRHLVRHLGLPGSRLLMNLAMLAVCVAVAELSRRLVEQPIVALKGRWDFRRTASGADLAAPASTPAYRGPHIAVQNETAANPERLPGRQP